MKIIAIIFICTAWCQQLKSQCLSGKVLWDSIVYLRQSDVSDSLQLAVTASFLHKAVECRYYSDSAYVLLLQRAGALNFYLPNIQKAISLTWQAVKAYNQYVARHYISPSLQVKNYFNLYLYYEQLGDGRNAARVVDSCILVSLRYGYADKYTLDALDEKATNQLETGDYHGCIKTTRITDHLKNGSPESYTIEEREKLIRLFSVRLNALIFLQRYTEAEKLLEGKKSEYVQLNQGNRLGNWYALMGKLRRRQGRFEETIELFRKSVSYHLKAGYPDGAAESLNNIGFVYLDNLSEFNKALPYFHQALKYANSSESLNILANIGNTYVRLNDFTRAFAAFQQAFDQISPGMNEGKLLTNPDSAIATVYAEYLLRLEIYKGDAYLGYFKESNDQSALHYAIAVYKSCDQLLNKLKAFQSDFQSKLFWRKDARQLYEHGIEASRLAGHYNDALYFFEKSRAVLLSDQLSARELLNRDEFARHVAIKKAISQLEATQHVQANDQEGNENDIFSYRLQLGRIERQVRERKLIGDQSVVSINDVREKILNTHEAFLAIYTGEQAVYVFIITKNRTAVNKISKPAYDSLLYLFTGFLSNHAHLNRNFKKFLAVSAAMHSLLFNGINLKPGRVIVSTDGTFIPFESLVCFLNGPSFKYFIEDHAVSYTYNAHYLINGFKNKYKSGRVRFMGFAPVNFPVSTTLASLPGSDHSIYRISKYFNDRTSYCFSNASRASFFSNYIKSDIIQLYTHGAERSERNEPVLFFADSALYLSELWDEHRPRTKLIVLAACESGLGDTYKGEGVFNFSRGFAAMGIPSSVTTLWSVDKDATFGISELFYKYIAEGHPTDIALQKAKLEFMSKDRQNALPYFWAAPVLIGSTEVLMFPAKNQNIWLLLFSLIAAAVIAFIGIKHLKKSA